jgi:hypothetical protein
VKIMAAWEQAEEKRELDTMAAILKANDEWTKECLAWKPGDPPTPLTGRLFKVMFDDAGERSLNAQIRDMLQ